MFSRISVVDRFILLQVLFIVMMILTTAMALRISGRGKHVDPAIQEMSPYLWRAAPLSIRVRDYGWTLLAIPLVFGLLALRNKGRAPDGLDDAPGSFPLVICLFTAGLFILGTWSTFQALKPRHEVIIKLKPPAEKPAEP